MPATNQAERRQIAVMFCDMVGSSALSTRLDPEEQREVVSAFHACCATEIRRLDGMVAQYLGDGVLAYFGYPAAHEDDAERAVRAGLAILSAVPTLAPAPGVRVQARIGIASGVVVVGDLVREGVTQENAAIGETTNLAARLQALAEPDTLVVSPDTHRLVGALFEYRDLGAQTLKGFGESVRVRQVLSASSVENRYEARHMEGAAPLLGREEDLDLLVRRWEQAKASEGRVVLVTGEAGIGKSRLTRALQERLSAEPHTRMIYHCSPYHQDSALHPVIGQLVRGAGFEREDSAEAKLDKLAALLAGSSEVLDQDLPLFAALLSIPGGNRAPLPNLTPQQMKERTLSALTAQLRRLCARQPVLMLFEDLHWIDPTSLELLGRVVEQAPGLRLLLLATARPEFVVPWPNHRHVGSVALSRLDRAEGEALVTGMTSGKALPSEVLDQIVARTDGVPLFIEELTKTVLESGLLRESGNRYELTGPLPPLAIPATLHASLLARLDRLASTKDVAQIGAAIGREFSYALIAAVAALPEADLRKALAQLVAAELIFRRGEPPDATYVFKHALVQDASYASLVRSRRQQIHGEIARVLEAKYPEIGASEPEILAHHFTEAGLIVQALHYWRNAGERALERSAGAETIAHLRRGIAVLATLPDTPDRDRQELTFQLGLGMALQVTRGWNSRDADSVYERARALAQRVGDDRGRFQAAWGQWIGSNTRGDSDTARAKNTELFCIAGRLDDPALLLQAHHSAWATALWEPNLIAVREHAAKGLALYSQEEHRSHAFLYGGHDAAMCGHALSGLAEWLLGFPNRADRSVRQAVDLGEALSHPPSLVFGLFSATINAYFRRDIAAVLDCANRTISVAEEFHLPIFGPGARILRGWALVERNDAGQGLIELRRGLNAFVATNFKLYSGFLRNALVDSYLRVGNIDAGLIASQEVLDYITSSGDGSWYAEALRARGELLVAAARHDEGETVLHRAIKLAKEQGARSLELRAATSLARFWRDQGKHIEARDLLAPVHAWFTEGFDTADLKDAKALLDELT